MHQVLVLLTTVSFLGDAMAGEPPYDTFHVRCFSIVENDVVYLDHRVGGIPNYGRSLQLKEEAQLLVTEIQRILGAEGYGILVDEQKITI